MNHYHLFPKPRTRATSGVGRTIFALSVSVIATACSHRSESSGCGIEQTNESLVAEDSARHHQPLPGYGPSLLEQEQHAEGGDDHAPLSIALDVPAAGRDRLAQTMPGEFADSAEFVLLKAQGRTIAIDLRTMREPSTCVADLRELGLPLVVSYDWFVDSIRVFSLPPCTDLRVGGFETFRQRLVLLCQETRYRQDSPCIPLEEEKTWQRESLAELRQREAVPAIYSVLPLESLPAMPFLDLLEPVWSPGAKSGSMRLAPGPQAGPSPAVRGTQEKRASTETLGL